MAMAREACPTPYWYSPKTPQVMASLGTSPMPPTPTPAGLSPNELPSTTDLAKIEEGKSVSEIESPPLSHKVLAELVGSFILVFVGCGSVAIDHSAELKLTPVGISVAWGLAAMVVIYTVGHISGAHLNPAVTIALAANKRFRWKHVPAYVVAQTAGALAANYILKALLGGGTIKAAATLPSDGTSDLQVIMWEIIISFILMIVICSVATDDRAINELSGVAIGGAILFNALIAGQVTGASMNPARSIGSALAATEYRGLWMYIVSPVIGTLLATVVYNLLRLPHDPNHPHTVVEDK